MKEIIERLKEMQDVGKLKAEFYGVLSQAIKSLQAIEEAGEEVKGDKIAKIINANVWGRKWEHTGDCVGEPQTCLICLCLNAADEILSTQIQPIITKKNLRIKELEEALQDECNRCDELKEDRNELTIKVKTFKEAIKELKWIKDDLAKRLKEVESESKSRR